MEHLYKVLPIIGAVTSFFGLCVSIFYSYKRNAKYKEELERRLIPTNISEIDAISPSQADQAIKELVIYTKRLAPTYIIGINLGGTLVSSFVALQVNIPSTNFIRCFVGKENIECSVEQVLSGTILIIDDASRSGSTIKKAKEYIRNKVPRNTKLHTAVLFTGISTWQEPMYSKLDYYVYALKNLKTLLPWQNTESTPKQQFETIRNKTLEDLDAQIRKKLMSQQT